MFRAYGTMVRHLENAELNAEGMTDFVAQDFNPGK